VDPPEVSACPNDRLRRLSLALDEVVRSAERARELLVGHEARYAARESVRLKVHLGSGDDKVGIEVSRAPP
jgi:hypothetical protein